MRDEPSSLTDLKHHWGSAYAFRHPAGGPYLAERRDNGARLVAVSAEAMLAKVRADYAAKPMVRRGRNARIVRVTERERMGK